MARWVTVWFRCPDCAETLAGAFECWECGGHCARCCAQARFLALLRERVGA